MKAAAPNLLLLGALLTTAFGPNTETYWAR
jgi:hypothetical protein